MQEKIFSCSPIGPAQVGVRGGGVGGRLHSLKLSETHDNWGFTQLVLPTFPELQGREMAAHIWFLKFH